MAKNNSVNLDITSNADGFDISGGTTTRTLTLTGANVTVTGSGANTYTMPSSTDTLVGRASTDTLTNKTFGDDVQFNEHAHFDAEVDNGNSGAADTIDWTAGNKQKSTLTGNCTFTFSPEPSGPCSLTLKLVQDATGSRTVTWPADVNWPGGTAPTLTTTGSATDIVSFYYDGTDFYGQAALNFS